MFPMPEQLSAASKASLEAQLALVTTLANKTFEGFGKIVDLNLNAVKISLEESNAAAKQLLAVKDAQEWLSLTAAHAQPTGEKALAYGRHLAGIASDIHAEFSKAAEEQLSESSRKVLDIVEELAKNAPAGSENAVAFLKSAIGSVNAGYEQVTKTTKQAVETLEANLNTAAGHFTQPKAATRASAGAKK